MYLTDGLSYMVLSWDETLLSFRFLVNRFLAVKANPSLVCVNFELLVITENLYFFHVLQKFAFRWLSQEYQMDQKLNKTRAFASHIPCTWPKNGNPRMWTDFAKTPLQLNLHWLLPHQNSLLSALGDFPYSGTPPYDHLIIRTLLYSFYPNIKITESFYYLEDPINAIS